MATESLINPFSDFGGIVYGERFVGRVDEINKIHQRVLGTAYGNMAIMGLPRIGKSSLAWEAIMTKKDELLKENTIPIFFQTGSCKSSQGFFQHLVNLLDDELQFICDDSRYEKFADPIRKNIKGDVDAVEFAINVQKYFKLVKKLGYKVIYILDEFDSVQSIFDISDFQMLRELSYNPSMKICLVTCSRKTIQEIEAINGALSNFYGTFSELRLGMFSENDMVDYWSKIPADFEITEDYKSTADYYVGRHPFLLDVFNDYCIKNNIVHLDDSSQLNEIRLALWHQFKTFQDTLQHENLLDTAIQLVIGPAYNVTSMQEEKLLKYQFIHLVDNEDKVNVLGRLIGPSIDGQSYMCFSDYFTMFFDKEHWESIDYWPLWTDTEKRIRGLIKIYVKECYSADWETEIAAKFGSSKTWNDRFEGLKRVRNVDQKLFPNASDNLVDYTLTRDMYDVFMSVAWQDWFGKVFEGQKKDWAKKFNFLADIRNPMAHNNREFISQETIQSATEICNDIIRIIGEWEAKQE